MSPKKTKTTKPGPAMSRPKERDLQVEADGVAELEPRCRLGVCGGRDVAKGIETDGLSLEGLRKTKKHLG